MVALDPAFTVGSLLREALRAHGMRRSATRARSVELLAMVGIPRVEETLKSYPHQLSGGMAQRVAIALALSGDPDLLIADEPTTALDVTVQAEILDLLRDLQQRTGMGLLLITHDLGVVADICTRAIVMYAGEVVEQSGIDPLFADPQHPYTAALMASTPVLDAAAELHGIPGMVPPPSEWPSHCRFAARCAFATDACREGPIPLAPAASGRIVRCIRADELDLRASQLMEANRGALSPPRPSARCHPTCSPSVTSRSRTAGAVGAGRRSSTGSNCASHRARPWDWSANPARAGPRSVEPCWASRMWQAGRSSSAGGTSPISRGAGARHSRRICRWCSRTRTAR